MARRGDGLVPMICPNGDYATRGLPGDRCPICEAEMLPDAVVTDTERSFAGVHAGDDDADEATKLPLDDLDDTGDPLHQSLESLADEEHSQSEFSDHDF